MSTADKLNKILASKEAIRQSIINKGTDVGTDVPLSQYASKIDEIVTGSGYNYYEELFNKMTNNNTNYNYLFYYSSAETIDVSGWDTSEVTNMTYMFAYCDSLTPLVVSNFDTSKVTNMSFMFYHCESLTSLDVSNWDVSKVTNMNSTFHGCYKLTSLDVSNWDTSSVTNMSATFCSCWELTSLDVSNWDVSKVTNMNSMFSYCTKLTSLDLSNWDVGHITASYNFTALIDNCTSLTDFNAPKNINANMTLNKCTALTHDSLMSIINNLKETTTTKTLTLGTTNLAKLSDEEKAIATGKGWTLK